MSYNQSMQRFREIIAELESEIHMNELNPQETLDEINRRQKMVRDEIPTFEEVVSNEPCVDPFVHVTIDNVVRGITYLRDAQISAWGAMYGCGKIEDISSPGTCCDDMAKEYISLLSRRNAVTARLICAVYNLSRKSGQEVFMLDGDIPQYSV